MNDLKHPGDYALLFDRDGSIKSLWFILPNSNELARIPAEGHGRNRGPQHGGPEPEWKITLEPDGTVTVDPSINSVGVSSWHGWLKHGVWSDA